MSATAKIIAHSVSPDGHELITMEVTFWRAILAELNTHCDFSRNSASSRARSVRKTLVEVDENPAFPPEFRKEKVGMSGGELLTGAELSDARATWRMAGIKALEYAQELVDLGVHKSIVNRLLEPFMWHTAVITATSWDNFFTQRLALLEDGTPAADPAMYELAVAMKDAIDGSVPRALDYNEWHLPYITQDDWDVALTETRQVAVRRLTQISVARCAGVSYLTQGLEGRDHEKDLMLFNRLRTAEPPHWSPFEHVAKPASSRSMFPARRYKLTGWASLRWFEENEIPAFDVN